MNGMSEEDLRALLTEHGLIEDMALRVTDFLGFYPAESTIIRTPGTRTSWPARYQVTLDPELSERMDPTQQTMYFQVEEL